MIGHPPPCWRDPQWPGPLPARIYNSEKARNQINADRLANATRLGEKCLDLTCEVCEDIGMLDIVEEFEQWPESLDTEADDIPVERFTGVAVVPVTVDTSVASRPSYAEAAKVRNVSFAEELRVREEEARRLAELNTAVAAERLEELERLKCEMESETARVAAERLEELERLKCEMESETARALVIEQDAQIARLTRDGTARVAADSTRLDGGDPADSGSGGRRLGIDTRVVTPPRAVPIEVGMVTGNGRCRGSRAA